MGSRILVAEDDPKQSRLLRLYLEREGHEVRVVHNGSDAISVARATRPDLVVLDVMLPDIEGHDVCRVLRRESDVPILMVTARTTEEDLLLGLELGADDYLTKPYRHRELLARARALLRRGGAAYRHDEVVRLGRLTIDPARFDVAVDDVSVPMTAREFAILHLLAREPGRVFTRAEIIDQAYGFDTTVLDRTIDAHVMNLRRKLDRAGDGATLLETVYGRGYRMSEVTTNEL